MFVIQDRASQDQYATAVDKPVFDGQYTVASVVVTLCIALALYNSLEMVLLISTTFKRWKGLYFWSLSVCNLGVILYTLGMMITYFVLSKLVVRKILLDLGWACMIICQSLVLYSRLGLIVGSERIVTAVKWMIIVNSVILVSITIVFDFGDTFSTSPMFTEGYFYVEHIQITIFWLQETVISSLYVWKTISLLKVIATASTRSMVWQVLIINLLIIGMDIVLVVLQYKRLQLYQESVKGFVYSVKLKLELNILSTLVDLVHGTSIGRSMMLDIIDSNTIPGQAQADVQREVSGEKHPNGWSSGNDKGAANYAGNGYADEHGIRHSPARPADGKDETLRVHSQNLKHSPRTSGRDSDILYADFVRSLK